MKDLKSRRSWIFWLTVPLIVVDQLTKVAAIQWLRGSPPRIFLGDLFRFQYAENPGAFLSLGSGMSDQVRFWVFTVAVSLFLIGCLVYLVRTPDLDRPSVIGLSLIAGGGLSNLLDRLFRTGGRVIDFMNMGLGELRTGIFNVADMAIVAGVALMVFASLRGQPPETLPGEERK